MNFQKKPKTVQERKVNRLGPTHTFVNSSKEPSSEPQPSTSTSEPLTTAVHLQTTEEVLELEADKQQKKKSSRTRLAQKVSCKYCELKVPPTLLNYHLVSLSTLVFRFCNFNNASLLFNSWKYIKCIFEYMSSL